MPIPHHQAVNGPVSSAHWVLCEEWRRMRISFVARGHATARTEKAARKFPSVERARSTVREIGDPRLLIHEVRSL